MRSSSSTLAVRTAAEMLYRGREAELDMQYPRVLVLLTDHWIGMEEGLAAVRRLAGMKLRLQLCIDPAMGKSLGRREIALATGVDDFLEPGVNFRIAIDSGVPGISSDPGNSVGPGYPCNPGVLGNSGNSGNHRNPGDHAGMELPLASNIQYLFIPVLSFSLMSRISRLDDESSIVRMILQGLCSGKKVAALRSGAEDGGPEWMARGLSMPPAMRHEAAAMLGTLRSYGITLLGSEVIEDWIASGSEKKVLIAGEDILSAVSSGVTELKPGRGSIITPLARDLAAQYGIQILQARDGETM
ncbi:hypothetical protein KIH86_11815 [Paenibacillus sp. HN-1]|uniref:hypothetical protein n=1 Tax=Paenibacillus TaxID=44249 RepID=UPI001CA98FE9|nr:MULTISPECIES: hypothetical protein [Paenibacillus]MBY9081388.1 hypothetical protein [Paenibacillus sp. CGMCC 1.18879]MBY9084908.1 hypothetical protein [Paenibacillus sinensis]